MDTADSSKEHEKKKVVSKVTIGSTRDPTKSPLRGVLSTGLDSNLTSPKSGSDVTDSAQFATTTTTTMSDKREDHTTKATTADDENTKKKKTEKEEPSSEKSEKKKKGNEESSSTSKYDKKSEKKKKGNEEPSSTSNDGAKPEKTKKKAKEELVSTSKDEEPSSEKKGKEESLNTSKDDGKAQNKKKKKASKSSDHSPMSDDDSLEGGDPSIPDLPSLPPLTRNEAIQKLQTDSEAIMDYVNGKFKAEVGKLLVDGYLACGRVERTRRESLQNGRIPKQHEKDAIGECSATLKIFMKKIQTLRENLQEAGSKLRLKSKEHTRLLKLLSDDDKRKHLSRYTAENFELQLRYTELFDHAFHDFGASVAMAESLLIGFFHHSNLKGNQND